MGERKKKKINQLAKELPEGLLADAKWMERHGYYGSLRAKYLASGWLEQPARGVYRRPRGELTWEQVVISLQTIMGYPVSVGGRTALELQGFAHFLTHSQREVFLYGDKPLSKWTRNLPIDTRFEFRNRKRLFPEFDQTLPRIPLDGQTHADSQPPLPAALRVFSWGHWKWPLVVSTPERAVLELLDELPNQESFHQVDSLMAGLATLSPRRLQELLIACRSIKVKRLFFFFADRHNHAWLQRIDRQLIDLGKGKRQLIPGGVLHPDYLITVPEDLYGV